MNRRNLLKSSLAAASLGLGYASSGNAYPFLNEIDLCDHDFSSTAPDSPKIIKLRSAENPYGPPQSAINALKNELSMGNRYPRSLIQEFRAQIGKSAGVTAEYVAIGAGSVELMTKLGLVFGQPGRKVLSPDPTWATPMKYAQHHGAEWITVPVDAEYRFNFDRMLEEAKKGVDLVYICHPNNPTARGEDHATLEAFVKEASQYAMVLIDEAFIDCLDHAEEVSLKKLIPQNDKVEWSLVLFLNYAVWLDFVWGIWSATRSLSPKLWPQCLG